MAISKLTLTMGGLLLAIFILSSIRRAIRLSGNVWINIPLCPGKMVSGMTARREHAVKGER